MPWVSFLSYTMLMAFTPGPNNIMSMNNAKNKGFRRGLSFNAGIFAGTFLMMEACMLFSGALYAIIPAIQFPMKILGAGYMLFLIGATLRPPARQSPERNTRGSFTLGFTLQWINPKLILYGITACTSYILPHYHAAPTLFFFALFLAAMAFTATACWALSGALFSALFCKHGKALNAIMAALLLYCAVSLFL